MQTGWKFQQPERTFLVFIIFEIHSYPREEVWQIRRISGDGRFSRARGRATCLAHCLACNDGNWRAAKNISRHEKTLKHKECVKSFWTCRCLIASSGRVIGHPPAGFGEDNQGLSHRIQEQEQAMLDADDFWFPPVEESYASEKKTSAI